MNILPSDAFGDPDTERRAIAVANRLRADMQAAEIMKRLIEARKRAGLTQGQVAKLAGYAGGASSFQNYESGKTALTMPLFLNLCDIYGVSPVWALTGVAPDFDTDEAKRLLSRVGDDVSALVELLSSLRK